MLDLIRRFKTLFSVLFVLAALGLLFSSMGPTTQTSLGGADTIARVEGEEIQSRELVNLLNQEMARMEETLNQQQGADQNAEYQKMMRQIMKSQINPQQLLERLLYQSLIYSTASNLNIHAAPSRIHENIQTYPDFQKEGRFDPLLYRQLVPRAALFESSIRKNLVKQTLYEGFESGLKVLSPQEVNEHQWLNQKITFEVVSINASQLPSINEPTAAQLEEFRKKADSEARLQDYYNKNISLYRSEGQVRARHILIKSGSDKDVKQIAKEVKDNKISFEDAAKKYSEDSSNASNGGDLGFFKAGMMVPEFEKAAFALKKPNDISGIVKTSFGDHLIQLIERQEATARSFDEVKEELMPSAWKEEQKQSQLLELIANWTQTPNGPSEKDLQTYKLKWETQEAWSPMEPYFEPIGNVESHLEALLSLNSAQPFLKRSLMRGDNYVLLRFKKSESESLEAKVLSSNVADNKINQAYEYFFKTLKEDLEKKKKIVVQEDKLAQLQKALENQL